METALEANGISCVDEILGDRIGDTPDNEFAGSGHRQQFVDQKGRQQDLALTFDCLGSLLHDPLARIILTERNEDLFFQMAVAAILYAVIGVAAYFVMSSF